MILRTVLSVTAFAVSLAWCGLSQATILTFDLSDSTLDTNVYPGGYPEGYGMATLAQPFGPLSGYGNRVNSLTGINDNTTTTFSYGEAGEGFTPNVTVGYGPHGMLDGGPVLWREDFGDLTNVLYQGGPSPFLEIQLVADPYYDALLYGFDLGGYQDNFPVKAVTVFDGYPNGLFFPTNQIFQDFTTVAPAPGGGSTHFSFATPLQSHTVFLRIDLSNLNPGPHDVVAIDNIQFGQILRSDGSTGVEVVPEPSSMALVGIGSLAALALRRRRRNDGEGVINP